MIATIIPGGWQLIVILVVVLLLFGKRIPELARSLGSGITEFKKGLKGNPDDDKNKLPPGGSAPQGGSTTQGDAKP